MPTASYGGITGAQGVEHTCPNESQRAGRVQSALGQCMPPPLSSREMEVLYLRTQGLFNREIAAQLFLAESTIRNYAHHAVTKLEARTLAGAIWKARRQLEQWEEQHGQDT